MEAWEDASGQMRVGNGVARTPQGRPARVPCNVARTREVGQWGHAGVHAVRQAH